MKISKKGWFLLGGLLASSTVFAVSISTYMVYGDPTGKKRLAKIDRGVLADNSTGTLNFIQAQAVLNKLQFKANKVDDLANNIKNFQVQDYFAGEFVNGTVPIFEGKISQNNFEEYWNKLLTIDSIGKKGLRIFTLKEPNLTPINIFRNDSKYVLNLKSYANDIKGILYLAFSVEQKTFNSDGSPTNQKMVVASRIYQISGFKKISQANSYPTSVGISKIRLVTDIPLNENVFNSVEEFKNQYNAVKDNLNKKTEFLKKVFDIKLSDETLNYRYDFNYADLTLNFLDNNEVQLQYKSKAKVYTAELNEANIKENPLSTSNSNYNKLIEGLEKLDDTYDKFDEHQQPKSFYATFNLNDYIEAINIAKNLKLVKKDSNIQYYAPTSENESVQWVNKVLKLKNYVNELENKFSILYLPFKFDKDQGHFYLPFSISLKDLQSNDVTFSVRNQIEFNYADYVDPNSENNDANNNSDTGSSNNEDSTATNE